MKNGWSPGPLKYWLLTNDSGVWGDEPTGEGDTEVLRSTDIRLDGGWSINDPAVRSIPPTQLRQKRLCNGDLVVVTSSGSAKHLGKTAIVTPEVAARGATFANFVQRLTPGPSADSRYLWYFLNSKQAGDEMIVLGNTTTGLRNLNGTILGALTFSGPPIAEQQAIVDFLDTETARIDALITKKQRMIELFVLRERVMVGEVFSGLSPGPRLGHVANIRSGAGFPHAHQGVSSGDMPFIKVSDLTSGSDDGRDVVRAANYVSTSTAKELGVRPASPGAVIFPKVGAALLGNARRIVKRLSAFDNNLMVVESREHDPRFLHFWFTLLDLGELANPGPVPSVNELAIKSLRPPLPTKNRQMELVNGLDDTLGTAAKVANALGRQVVLLRERKQALITAAVTGELEIT